MTYAMFFLALLGAYLAYHGCFMSGSPAASWPNRLFYFAMAMAGLAMINWAGFTTVSALLRGRAIPFGSDALRLYRLFSLVSLYGSLGAFVLFWVVAIYANLMRGDQLARWNADPGDSHDHTEPPHAPIPKARASDQHHVEEQWHA